VSVVIPTYNRAHLIGRALDSVLGQVEPGDEVIVIDDGSSDNTKDVVESYGDKVRFVRITNSGAGAARNRGIREAKNALVAFLDSDDEWMAGKLALQRKLMAARPDVLFCFSDISITTKRGGIVRNYLRFWHNDRRGWDQILNPGVPYSSIVGPPEARDDFMVHTGQLYASLAKAIYVVTSTTVARRVEAGDALRYEEDLPMYEDWLCFARLARKGPGASFGAEVDRRRQPDPGHYPPDNSGETLGQRPGIHGRPR
jgi:glycosyltransferase involved in cell wall biosynthesis